MLRESAQGLANRAHDTYLAKRTPAEAAADLRKVIDIAARECLSKGITTFEDAGSPLATADMFRSMAEQNELPLRLWVMLRGSNDLLAKNLDRYRTLDVGAEPSGDSRHQALYGWRAGLARRMAARALHR